MLRKYFYSELLGDKMILIAIPSFSVSDYQFVVELLGKNKDKFTKFYLVSFLVLLKFINFTMFLSSTQACKTSTLIIYYRIFSQHPWA